MAGTSGSVVANLVTDTGGTCDVNAAPTVENNAVLVPITDVTDYFTGATWSAGMEVAGRIVSTCGTLPTDVPADAP